ncbi:peptidase associated/transthyretin-like domain-containing protein [Hymenobacter segetis]|uniref:Carboxypeptidase regulatory-like domain-containing protein n=1 Tax=Hymenobacter segetis TaxID=2025509 RepID=A0ABU9LWS2_9BACT
MISIPKPCAESWDAMMPTADGRQCGRCQTEVVDFTRMSQAEILAFMAARKGQRVCAFMAVPVAVLHHPKRWSGPRRWLLAVAAFLSGQQVSAAALPPQPLLIGHSLVGQNPGKAMITIRGVVIDDSLNVPVAGARVYFGETQYGTVANERGEFSFSFPADWAPAKSGIIKVRVGGVPFALAGQAVEVSVKVTSAPSPLTIRLLSIPERGFRKGKARLEEPPVPLPGPRKSRR